MKVSHHGSADPGLPDVLRAPAARRWRRSRSAPATTTATRRRSTLAALRAVPRVYRTDRDGTVVLRVAGGRMTVETGA